MATVAILWQTLAFDSWGAAFARRGHAFLRHLGELGYRTVLIAFEYRRQGAERNSVTTPNTHATWRTTAPGNGRLASLLSFPMGLMRLGRVIRKVKPSVLLVSSHDALQELQIALASRLANVPCILDIQDSWIVLGVEHPRESARLANRRMESAACRLSDAVFVMTNLMAQEIIARYHVLAGKVHVVPNGAEPVARSLPMAQRDIDLIHLGPPRPVYDTNRLVDALLLIIEKLPNTRIQFLGHDDAPYSKAIEARLGSHQGGNVDFVPFVAPEAVPMLLAKAKLGLHSYRLHDAYRLTVGTKVYEYLAAGVPVVHLGPNEGEVGHLIDRYGCGFATSDPRTMADWVAQTLQSPETLETLSANACVAATQYAWRGIVEKAASHIERIGKSEMVQFG